MDKRYLGLRRERNDPPPACEATLSDLDDMEPEGSSDEDKPSVVTSLDLDLVCRLAATVSRLRGQRQDTLSVMKHLATEVVEATIVIGTPSFPEELCDIVMCCLTIAANEGIDLSDMIGRVLDKNLNRVDPLAD